MIVTIDGPAGTGKTTVARLLAERLQFAYFDTGAMYRAVTYAVIRERIDLNNQEMLDQFLKNFHFDIRDQDKTKSYFIDQEDVTDKIRSPEVNQKVSEVSAHPAVRKLLIALQREFGTEKNAIFEGRDIGTVVFPDAEIKIFLQARPEIRAERRYLEFKEKNVSTTQERVLYELFQRDHSDSTREISPLIQAEDAYVIDTSELSIEQTINKILSLIPH